MHVCLIEVPYHAGDERLGSSMGPGRLLDAGAESVFSTREVGATVARVERDGPFRDTAASAAAVNTRLAEVVRRVIDDGGGLPIVLSGSCNSALGVLAGFEHNRCGAVWLDAHADFNDPETTESGFFAGMSLAVIAGHCYRSYWAESVTAERERSRRAIGRVRGHRRVLREEVEQAQADLQRLVRRRRAVQRSVRGSQPRAKSGAPPPTAEPRDECEVSS